MEGKAILQPVLAPPHAEGGEPVVLARPGDRTNRNPDPGDGRSSAALAALRVAPLDPRRLIVGPRIPHGCPGEGYRRPAEGGAEAVRAPRGGRSPWTRTKIPSMGFRHRAIRRGCFAYRSTACVASRRSTSDADGDSPARRPTIGGSPGGFSTGRAGGNDIACASGSIGSPRASCVSRPRRGPQSSWRSSLSTVQEAVPVG